ncbi:MAG: succinate dehydrogenase [Hyphomicrobiales bacterium]|nr:succinate dehydrogenase [Hyphomicrobiales bacterium]
MWLWAAQRASAAVLAITVAGHLGVMVYAIRGGLTAAEITGRLAGNGAFLAFYTVFLLAVSVHGAIGLRAILREWTRLPGGAVNVLCLAVAVALLLLGWRAVHGLYALGGLG